MRKYTWIIVGLVVLVVAYLFFSPKTRLAAQPAATGQPGGLGGTLAGAGTLAHGLSNLWDSVWGTFDGSTDGDAE